MKILAQGVQKLWPQRHLTFTFDLDLDPMSLIPKHDLDIMEIYHHAKNESRGSRGSKVIAKKHFDLDL